ncbi:hypothetical protein [Metabacillus arenae]|uniref:Uncharacterized protein n=1 Tax=Metabacillus arenae TaxID=2771434 RepID=A0A926RW06_9BACI|nr:hypothetical protein [Metabacillus arenae]MBD1379055.1 hypothetical protein [Metabacillus arenae]
MNYEDALEVENILNNLSESKETKQEVARLKELLGYIIQNEKDINFKKQKHISTTWNNFTPIKEISKVINVLCNCNRYYDDANEEVRIYQRETQDILHALELTELEDEEMIDLMEELKTIRVFRRRVKNFIEAIEPLHEFVSNNPDVVNGFKNVHSKMDSIRIRQGKKRYSVREKTSLSSAFEKTDGFNHILEELLKRENSTL